MAMRIRLTSADLGRVRFGMSAVYETVRALDTLADPGAHAINLPWVRWAAPRLPRDPDVTLLRRLLSGRATPVSLLPPPDSRLPALASELRLVRQANPARVRDSLRSIFGERSWLATFHEDTSSAMARMADAIERVHDALIAPHWPRIRSLLDADIEHRARLLSERGAETMIGGLHRDVRWDGGDILVWAVSPTRDDGEVVMSGHGLVLNPSVFCWPDCTSTARPVGAAPIRYPVRGIGTLWETPKPREGNAIAELIGPSRAAILDMLADLADTPTLARRLGVTPGAVSQHLRVLRAAGLVRTQKTGRTAVHLRTAKADALLS